MKKRGVFFSTDAIIGLMIILLVVLVAIPLIDYSKKDSEIHSDLLEVLSNIQVGEIDNPYIKSLIANGTITNPEISALEQIGEFYVTDKALARNMANAIISDIDTKENIGIWYGSSLIASKNTTPFETAEEVNTARQIISGLVEGESVTGFSARASLAAGLRKDYFYFGGYIGDGNISALVKYNGVIDSAEIELVVSDDFELYINDVFIGDYEGSIDDFTPISYDIPVNEFESGENLIELRGNNLHVTGGFIKISYESQVDYERPTQKYLPGLDGVVNVYDGLTIPGNLTSIDISIHLQTNNSVFMKLGNTTVFSGNTDGEETISIPDSTLSTLLDYDTLSFMTTPLRIGVENVSYIVNGTNKEADVFSVTDLSGSMCGTCTGGSFWCCLSGGGCSNSEPVCTSCGGECQPAIQEARDANKLLIDKILNSTSNRVGLTAYKNNAANADYHNLSNDSMSLKAEVDSWKAVSNTCICCGINKAVQGFIADSDESKLKVAIVMSDGEANVRCPLQDTGNAKQDAIQAACSAYQDYNITVHAVGFGSSADEETLQSIAACGNGSYYFADVSELGSLYQQIADELIEGTYTEQTVDIEGGLQTTLFPDSYIELQYDETPVPYGLVITSEESFTDAYSGQFSLQNSTTLLEANAVSYSGTRWTDKVILNNETVYNLSDYGQDYVELGDPYSIQLPLASVQQDNQVYLTTGLSPKNSSQGSLSNKIIYTVVKNSTSFSPIVASAEGCIWSIPFEDSTNITLPIPDTYTGSEQCSYLGPEDSVYNNNDALQTAVYNLFRDLDLDQNGLIDVQFTEKDIDISLTEVTGIPFTFYTDVQIRRWR